MYNTRNLFGEPCSTAFQIDKNLAIHITSVYNEININNIYKYLYSFYYMNLILIHECLYSPPELLDENMCTFIIQNAIIKSKWK